LKLLLSAAVLLVAVSYAAKTEAQQAVTQTSNSSSPANDEARGANHEASREPDSSSTAFMHIPDFDPAMLEGDDEGQASQQSSASGQSNLPAAPMPQNGTSVPTNRQTKRILGIIPNFRSVSADDKLPPQTVKEKFIDATQDSFDYSSVLIPILLAGFNMAEDATPEFGQGARGYGRYFWHSAVDQTSENYFVEFAFPVLTHEDSRYYTKGRGGFWKRTGYAMSRSVITRTDKGKETFNLSEVLGAGSSAALSTAYYPSKERTFSNVGTAWALDVGIDSFTIFLREFWPDINHKFFHYTEE
jgi:hypothetical protein